MLLHVLAAYWIRLGGKLEWATGGADAICWPLLPECEGLRVLSLAALDGAWSHGPRPARGGRATAPSPARAACARMPRYRPFWHNEWIQAAEAPR